MARKKNSQKPMNKSIKKEMDEYNPNHTRYGLTFLAVVFLFALGFACLIQGIHLQWFFGFKYGFFAYLLSFIFLGVAKMLKWKMHHGCCERK